MKNEMRVMFTRRRKELTKLFEEAGKVVDSAGVQVGGDVRVAWDTDNPEECKAVGKLFDELRAAGYTAVKVGDDGKLTDGERIEKFERGAGRMVLLPKMAGGA